MKYNLFDLTWQEFEVLAFKCLQNDVARAIQFVDGGSDKGRDILFKGTTRFFGENVANSNSVFQIKHKSKGSFSALVHDLGVEINKVFVKHRLKFDNYCLVTNLSISGDQFDELQSVFKAFVTENPDLKEVNFTSYSYRNLEAAIDRDESIKWSFPGILSHADLRLLLHEIFNRKSKNVSNAWKSILQKNCERFVYTSFFDEGLNHLTDKDFTLLSGPPKSGKTFTAEMILLHFAAYRGFDIYKIENVEDFEILFNKNEKQIFLFDDIFGRHDLDLYRADIFDRKFELLFELCDDSHKCIFTSREYILRGFNDYASDEIEKILKAISIDSSKLSRQEKESIFLKYYLLKERQPCSLDESFVSSIAAHRNFSPETIRAYFDDSSPFNLPEFLRHLEFPEKYLEKLFHNLSENKKLILLSVLFSIKANEDTIAYSYKMICEDMKKSPLVNLRGELQILTGSIIKYDSERYYFYHPSMFDFFTRYLSADIGIYRQLLLRNISPAFLQILRFSKSSYKRKGILVSVSEIQELGVGLQRIVVNPYSDLTFLNSIFSWLLDPDLQLHLKVKHNTEYKHFERTLFEAFASLNVSRFMNESCYAIAFFLKKLHQNNIQVQFSFISRLLENKRDDPNYWLVVFTAIPLLPESVVLEQNLPGKAWLNQFFIELRDEINYLGKELFGEGYPDFEDNQIYQRLVKEERFEEANKVKRKTKGDYKQSTRKDWYPRYKICKEKISVLKISHPHGYKIFKFLVDGWEILKLFESNQKNRFLHNKKKKWWT